MAFDGVMINALVREIGEKVSGGRIDKIYQPEKDDIILQVRALGTVYRLFLSANPSNPRFNITERKYENPKQPPLFCMVLRKHIGGGRIVRIIQPEFERVVVFETESLNEMGDYVTYKLILEVMGRHSNLILLNDKGIILEAARHINYELSSVREVLPGKVYVKAPSQGKLNPTELDRAGFFKSAEENPKFKAYELIYKCYTGISPLIASEICFRSGVEASDSLEALGREALERLFKAFSAFMADVAKGRFSPHIYFQKDAAPKEFAPFELKSLKPMRAEKFSTCSQLLEAFYSKRDMLFRMGQKTRDLRKLINNNIERCVKKKDIQRKTLKSIENREKHRLYGELLVSYAYLITSGAKEAKVINFYDEEQREVTIPLDEALSVQENANRYFKKYNKEKRTFAALQEQIKENDEELYYLESVLASLDECKNEQDIKEIRRELFEQGFIKKHKGFEKNRKSEKRSAPLKYISSDGFVICVGKNNTQNDELTMKTAKNSDLWFHTKQIPGSHVVVFAQGREVPERTITEAAMLAAYYSKARAGSLVPVDYTPRRFIKKPNGAKPGFVIYTTNKTAFVTPTEDFVENLSKNSL